MAGVDAREEELDREKHVWSNRMEDRNIYFSLDDEAGDDGIHDEGEIFGPMFKSISQEYGAPGVYNWMFREKISYVSNVMEKGDFKRSPDFFNDYLVACNPQKAADPFYMFGGELYSVRQLKDISRAEGISLASWVDSQSNTTVEKVSEFLRKITKYQDRKKNFLGNVIRGILIAENDDADADLISNIKSELYGTDVAFTTLWDYLDSVYLNSLRCRSNSEIEENIDRFKEPEFKAFSSFLLGLDGYCFPARTLVNEAFNNTEGKTQTCTLDLLYKCRNTEYKDLMSIIVDIEPSIIDKDTVLLWQCLEQLLAMVLEARRDTSNKTIIFQPALIINNDKVRAIVLALDVNTYEMLLEQRRAKDTIKNLLVNYARQDKMWYRLYVDSNNYHVCQSADIAKNVVLNFGKEF